MGGNVALGRQCCSGERMLLWGEKLLWGGNVALGRECCSGEGKLLWGGNVALGKESCSGEEMLLWGSKITLGRQCCSGGRRNCHGEKKKLSKKKRIFPILGKIREILQKIEGISGDFVVEKKRFGRQ